MEDMDYAKVKNTVITSKKRVAGQTGPELSSYEELRAQFSTVRNPNKKTKKLSNDDVKQSSNKNKKNMSEHHNQAKERVLHTPKQKQPRACTDYTSQK
jgi:hypothetical protein